jgi:hypothetical protein
MVHKSKVKEEYGEDEADCYCLECGKHFHLETDLELCDKCMKKFDTEKLWKLHDQNKLDALDFNESQSFRERFRIKR